MTRYIVTRRYICQDLWDVQANSKAEAIIKAEQEILNFQMDTIRRYKLQIRKALAGEVTGLETTT